MKNLKLFQTQITCETGPGNPSGHVMINMVIGLSIVRLLENLIHSDETNTVGRVNLFNDVHCVQGELTLFLNDYFCVTNMLKQHNMLF